MTYNTKEKINAYGRKYYHLHKTLHPKQKVDKKLSIRKTNLKSKHKLMIEDYNNLFEKQQGFCGICELPNMNKVKKYLCVDHDHKTGKIRGLLCSKCNMALGGFNDDVENLKRAIKWIQ